MGFLVLIMRMICMMNMDMNMMNIIIMSKMDIMVITIDDNEEVIMKIIIIIMMIMNIMRNNHHQNNQEMVEGIEQNVDVEEVKNKMVRENIIRDEMDKQRMQKM